MRGPRQKVREIVERGVIRPIARFIQSQASSGVLLLAMTLVALVWANSSYGESYKELWETELAFRFGSQAFSLDLHHWINDGLMAVFFLLVGLEIKREVLVGELSSAKSAALPIIAAVGGMAVPATVYALVNHGQTTGNGWAIPMATDIAFSLGVLALLGSRAPLALKVFLTALAIVDDLGAVIVIALFYSQGIDAAALGTCLALVALLIAFNAMRVRALLPYLAVGVMLWLAFLGLGVHASIAGVVVALTIPTRVRTGSEEFQGKVRRYLQEFADAKSPTAVLSDDEQASLHAIEVSCEEVQMPLQRLEQNLHTPVNFVVMPLFALANAGVALSGFGFQRVTETVALGVVLGLVLGKVVGIAVFSWIGVKLRLASLPSGVRWSHIVGVGFLGGIGFTMSLFIAGLAFRDPALGMQARLGILVGSALSGLVGAALLASLKPPREPGSVEAG